VNEEADIVLSNSVDRTLTAYSRAVRRAVERAEGPGRLTMPQRRCLQALVYADSLGSSQLARLLGVAPPTVTRMLDVLVERGLATRVVHPEDRRQVCIGITPAGRTTVARYDTLVRSHIASQLASLPLAAKERIAAAMVELDGVLSPES
jgi:DNA-binding MarR family transcriptional regulator